MDDLTGMLAYGRIRWKVPEQGGVPMDRSRACRSATTRIEVDEKKHVGRSRILKYR